VRSVFVPLYQEDKACPASDLLSTNFNTSSNEPPRIPNHKA
jgi:hypothetical protein